MTVSLARPENVPTRIAAVWIDRRATLQELDTVYSLEDLQDMLEMMEVESFNTEQMTQQSRRS